jgi:Domain of unknown function (DUF1707)
VAARPGGEPDKSQQVIEALTAAFIQGRLDKDEFDQRVAAALAAYAELDALTADIPASEPAVPSPAPVAVPSEESRQITREAYNRGLAARATFGGAGGVMLVAFIAATVGSGNPFLGFMLSGALGAFIVVLLGTVTTLMLWVLESSGGKSSRRTPPPQARGSSAEPLASPEQDGARRPRRDTWHTAEATA